MNVLQCVDCHSERDWTLYGGPPMKPIGAGRACLTRKTPTAGVNAGQAAHGLQIAVVNYAESLHGLQLGLVCIANNADGHPILPIVNWSFEEDR